MPNFTIVDMDDGSRFTLEIPFKPSVGERIQIGLKSFDIKIIQHSISDHYLGTHIMISSKGIKRP